MTPITPASDISTSATGLYYTPTFGVGSHFLPMSAGFPAEDNSILGGNRTNETNGSVQAHRRSGSVASDGDRRKRRRVRRACDVCKARKRRCTGDQPCPLCVSHGTDCTYDTPHGRPGGATEQTKEPSMFVGTRSPATHRISESQTRWPGAQPSVELNGRHDDGLNTNSTSRAVSPNGEGITPAGYQGPTSTFSVSPSLYQLSLTYQRSTLLHHCPLLPAFNLDLNTC